ncbi:MAG TPA: permease-like cell division protein FtsX [Acidimicrobiia bacterium]|nr:permease-like cell division protein FtsX [Acidimicrobiia bacterium]
MSRLSYFGRETAISLRRNLLMTIAGIITVAISLLLFGGILLVQRTVEHGTNKWKHGVELEIFMKTQPNAPDVQVNAIRDALTSDPNVKTYRFLNHDDAMEEFKKIFRDQPELIKTTTPDALPESFRVTPKSAEFTEEVAAHYQELPGVDTVVTAQQQVKRLLNAIRIVRLMFFGMAAALLASSLFLIVNTIRLATFARRREIEVMKLVGASNWFVRVPFMAEGLIQGAVGAGFAFGLIYALKVLISNVISHRHDVISSFYITNTDAISIGLIVVFVGAMIGTVGSAIGLRRFLEV